MKNTLIAIFAIFGIFEFINICSAAYVPLNIGSVSLAVSSGTATDIQNSTATVVGTARFCWNCGAAGGAGTICFSTGTTNWGSFVLSTGTRCQ